MFQFWTFPFSGPHSELTALTLCSVTTPDGFGKPNVVQDIKPGFAAWKGNAQPTLLSLSNPWTF